MKSKKILSMILIILIIIQCILPVLSSANDNQINNTISVTLERDNTNSNIINITATDTSYDIIQLKYVHKRIEISEIDYFEQGNSDVHNIEITQSREINESFELEGYGTYTVYAKNSAGIAFLSRITINNPSEIPEITLTKDDDNPMYLNIIINAINNITTIKIAKKENINDEIDFSQQGTDIEFVESNNLSLKYTELIEEGLYEVYVVDNKGNKSTSQIYLANQNTPIYINISTSSEDRNVKINIIDKICDIIKVKVAKSSDISSIDDFETKGEELVITKGKELNLEYNASEEGYYIFYIEDEAGYKYTKKIRVVSSEQTINVEITQNQSNYKEIIINATNTICDIVEMKIAIGNNINIEYFKNNGEEINITQGKDVTANYILTENSKVNIYVKDEEGYSYMLSKFITVINDEQTIRAPEITLEQDSKNPKQINVTVGSVDSYIRKIKWEKGSKTVDYFNDNGTQIGIGLLGKIIQTDFIIDSVGIYTVYAENNDGIKTVKEINILDLEQKDEKFELGDINQNNKIDSNDVLQLLRHISAKKTGNNSTWLIENNKIELADVNKNGQIDTNDVLKLKRYIAASKSEEIANKHPEWLEL